MMSFIAWHFNQLAKDFCNYLISEGACKQAKLDQLQKQRKNIPSCHTLTKPMKKALKKITPFTARGNRDLQMTSGDLCTTQFYACNSKFTSYFIIIKHNLTLFEIAKDAKMSRNTTENLANATILPPWAISIPCGLPQGSSFLAIRVVQLSSVIM